MAREPKPPRHLREVAQGLGHGVASERDDLEHHEQQSGAGAAALGQALRGGGDHQEQREEAEQEVERDGVGQHGDVP